MKNLPEVTLGIVAVSRDCFPVELSHKRRVNVVEACKAKNVAITEIETIVENETDAMKALAELQQKNVNALVLYLGNFGPEGPTTLLAQKFDGPVMFVAAAEESGKDLFQGRGDAYCGMLNASYNAGLRKLRPYIPEYPVGMPDEVAGMIGDFLPIARILSGLKGLKIFSFGPRPQDFLACNAPIKALYDIGVEIMENSELDLYDIFLSAKDNPAIKAVVEDMAKELGSGNAYPDLLHKLAQHEVALTTFMEQNLGASKYGIFANKCWPAFEKFFTFVPCYVNSRMAGQGIPVSCEVDIYGALSEYMAICATQKPATILDINNSVPYDMVKANAKLTNDYKANDMFMGFHCGNTPKACMRECSIAYQLIMHRLMEPGSEPDITRGTLEGRIAPGEITILRLQAVPGGELAAYAAEGEVLDVNPQSFGGIGVIAIPQMARFYRRVLLEKAFPHHTAVAFARVGHTVENALRLLGVSDFSCNLPAGMLYPEESPYW